MSFESKAQQKFMFSQHPEMAKEFAANTHDIKDLPERKNALHHLHTMRIKKHKRKHAFV